MALLYARLNAIRLTEHLMNYVNHDGFFFSEKFLNLIATQGITRMHENIIEMSLIFYKRDSLDNVITFYRIIFIIYYEKEFNESYYRKCTNLCEKYLLFSRKFYIFTLYTSYKFKVT